MSKELLPSNLVSRLRSARDPIAEEYEVPSLFIEAADEIERLTAERARLRAALERYGSHWNDCASIFSIDATCTCGYREFCPQCKAAGLPVETKAEEK